MNGRAQIQATAKVSATDPAADAAHTAFSPPSRRNRSHDLPASFKRLIQMMLDGLPHQAGVLAWDGTILAVNQFWRRFVDLASPGRPELGKLKLHGNYFDFLREIADLGNKEGPAVLERLKRLMSGASNQFQFAYDAEGPLEGRSFRIQIAKITSDDRDYLLVSREEVTELAELKLESRDFGNRLSKVEEEERRRIARELHDSASQLIVGLQLALAGLSNSASQENLDRVIDECGDTIQSLHKEIRSLTFLRHPPELKPGALVPALVALASGFEARSELRVETHFDVLGPQPRLIELTLYRIAQEALTNVHRHARATNVVLTLAAIDGRIRLAVQDDGVGFESGRRLLAASGVGLSGMRERVEQLGGHLTVRSKPDGTLIEADLPLEDSSEGADPVKRRGGAPAAK